MSIQVQHRRDANTVIETVTPAAGEIGFDTTKKELLIGDAATLGGIRHQKKNTREGLAPTQIAANTNDYNPTGLKHAAVLELTTDTSRNLTGLVPTTAVDTTDGRQILLYNNGSFNLVVQDQNAASAAANRFDLGGADITLSPKQSIALRYNLTSTRWQIVGGNYGQAISDGGVSARKLATSAMGARLGMINGTLVESHAGSAATFAIKTLAGADPSATDPVYFMFNTGAGAYVVRTVTAALSLTISSGSAMGAANATPFRLWLLALDNAGTVEIAAVNCSDTSGYMTLDEATPVSTTAEGGAGAADLIKTIYSASARTSKYMCIAGFATYETGLTTAGTWAASPTTINLFGPGTRKPGDVLQEVVTATSTSTNVSTLAYANTTLAAAITLSSAANLVDAYANGALVSGGSAIGALLRLFRGAAPTTPFGNVAYCQNNSVVGVSQGVCEGLDKPGVTTSVTYNAGLASSSAGTAATFPFSGAVPALMRVKERMG